MTVQRHKTAGNWALAILSGVGVGFVFYAAIYMGLSTFHAAKATILGNAPDVVLQALSFGIACTVAAEVLLWVLRLPKRK